MQLYEMQVSKTAIYRTAPVRIPKGIVGAAVKLSFSPEWEGLKKTVIFRAGDVVKDVLDIKDVAVIPAECTREAGVLLEIGVYGVDAESAVAIPTLWAAIGRVTEAADPSGDTTTDPQLPVWAQLQAQIHQLERQGVTQNEIEQAVLDYFAENEITPETVGAAPAGFGLGTVANTSHDVADANALPGTGWFRCNINTPDDGWWYGVHTVVSSARAYQRFTRVSTAWVAERHKIDGVWQPWEWVNPPLYWGREYLTTERWNEQRVYAKNLYGAVSFSTSTAQTVGIAHDITNYSTLVRCVARKAGTALPWTDGKAFMEVDSVSSSKIFVRVDVKSGSSFAYSGNLYFTLYYTKK